MFSSLSLSAYDDEDAMTPRFATSGYDADDDDPRTPLGLIERTSCFVLFCAEWGLLSGNAKTAVEKRDEGNRNKQRCE